MDKDNNKSFVESISDMISYLMSFVFSSSPVQDTEENTEENTEEATPKKEKSTSKKKVVSTKKSKKSKKSSLEGVAGDCLYTAVDIVRGGNGNEDALRQIATNWLIAEAINNPTNPIFQYGNRDAMVLVVSAPQAWDNDAGDLSAVVLAYSLGIELHVVTSTNTYIFNNGGGAVVQIYYHNDHYTSYPVEEVHDGKTSKIYSKPKKKSSDEEDYKREESDEEIEEEVSKPKVPRNYLDSIREQELRVLLKGLGNQANLDEADRSVMGIVRRALKDDFLSKANEGLIKTYVYNMNKKPKTSNGKVVVPPYAVGGIATTRNQFLDHINNYIPSNGEGDVSGAMNDLESGTKGKATTGYPGVLHASAGKRGAKGGCTLFFRRDGNGNLNLVGIGQHTGSSSYEIFWSSVGMPKNIQL